MLVFSVVFAAVVSGYFFLLSSRTAKPDISPGTGIVSIGDLTIPVVLADTPALRERGLSGRASLSQDSGMLFVMDSSDVHAIWMKDMRFPIDIIWIDEFLRIVTITADASPNSYPTVFYPSSPAKYILEVNTGFAREHGISVGDRVSFENALSN